MNRLDSLPLDTPEQMVRMFQEQKATASPELKMVLDGLIAKWTGWHATTFRFLKLGGYGGLRISNYDELCRMCVLL